MSRPPVLLFLALAFLPLLTPPAADACSAECICNAAADTEHWALYEYELDAERRIVGGEALYASSSSFAAAQLAQGSPNPAMPAGHYTVFTYQIDHAQNRPGSPNLRAFRKAIKRELEGSLPTQGQVAIRIAIDADGRIDDYDVLLSEPADLGDILAPHLHLYPAYAEQPAGKPIVDAVWMQVSQGQLGNFFQSGYVFERLR